MIIYIVNYYISAKCSKKTSNYFTFLNVLHITKYLNKTRCTFSIVLNFFDIQEEEERNHLYLANLSIMFTKMK